MFSLIITIIAIALVAGLTIASLFYGGAAFTQNSVKSTAAALISQAQQIAAANTLYANDNSGAFAGTDPTALVSASPAYLSTLPKVPKAVEHGTTPAWAIESATLNNVYVRMPATTSDEVCKSINKSATGATGALPAAVADVATARAALTGQFGCAPVTAVGNVFIYKG